MTKTRVNHRHVSINLCIKTRTRLEVLGRLRIPSRYGYVVRSNVIGDCVTRVEVLMEQRPCSVLTYPVE